MPATPEKSVSVDAQDNQENATKIDAQEDNKGVDEIVTSGPADEVADVEATRSEEQSQPDDAVSHRDIATTSAVGTEERPTSAAPLETTSTAVLDSNQATNISVAVDTDHRLPSTQTPVLAKTRNLQKTDAKVSPTDKITRSEETGTLPSSKSTSSISKTPSKSATSAIRSSSVKLGSDKKPTQPAPAKTPKITESTNSVTPSRSATRSVASPSPASTSSSRLNRSTESSAKKGVSSPIEHAAEHAKHTKSARAIAAATPSRMASSFAASGSGSRPTSVQSSSSTAKVRRTPLASSTSRRTASESTDGKTASPSLDGTKGKKAMTPAEIGRMQVAASPSSSKTALARSRSGLSVPPATLSTPAKSPTKSSNAGQGASPASTPPNSDTLARLMRPTIASQAHARSPARSPSAALPSPSPSTATSPRGGTSRQSAGAPTSLKKARSYAGTSASGTRAKVPRESLAKADSKEIEQLASETEKSQAETVGEPIPEVDDIPENPAENDEASVLESQPGIHSKESSAGLSEGDLLAPPLSTIASSVTDVSAGNDPATEPDEAPGQVTEKVFTGFGPNRPYGKIGLPTEEATPEETATRPSDEENKILPPTLRIKQPRELEEILDGQQKDGSKQADFADKWGSRDGGSPLHVRSPGLTSVKSNDGNDTMSSSAAENGNGNAESKGTEKKVPIWMRKGGEA